MKQAEITEQALMWRIDEILVRNQKDSDKEYLPEFQNPDEQKKFEDYQKKMNDRSLEELMTVYREAFRDAMRLSYKIIGGRLL